MLVVPDFQDVLGNGIGKFPGPAELVVFASRKPGPEPLLDLLRGVRENVIFIQQGRDLVHDHLFFSGVKDGGVGLLAESKLDGNDRVKQQRENPSV